MKIKDKVEYHIIPEILVFHRFRKKSLSNDTSYKQKIMYSIQEPYYTDLQLHFGISDRREQTLYRGWREYFYGDKRKARTYWRKLGPALFRQPRAMLAWLVTFLPENIFVRFKEFRLKFRLWYLVNYCTKNKCSIKKTVHIIDTIDKPMKVLLIADDMFPGGVSRHITDLSNELHRKGINVVVAATAGHYRSKLNNEIQFVQLFLTKEKSSKKNIVGLVSSYFQLRKIVRLHQFDIIHSHKRYSSYFVEKFLKKGKFIHITSYHSLFDTKIAFSTFGDYTICCSDAVRQHLIKNNGCSKERSKTIYNGIDPFRVHDENQKKNTYRLLGIPEYKKVISSVGQFSPSKDRASLILSIDKLRKQYDVSQLAIVLQGYGQPGGKSKKSCK